MIKLNEQYENIGRDSKIVGTLQIEIVGWNTTKEATIYSIEDFIIDDNDAKHLINTRKKRIENDISDQLDAYVNSTTDFEGMSKSEVDWLKAKIGLLIFVQGDLLDDGIHTIYNKMPEDWILC